MAAEKRPGATGPLCFLLALNIELAAKENAEEKITPSGMPLAYHTALITEDCIGACLS